MDRKTSKLKTYFSLFTPSASGIVTYFFLAGLAIVLNQFDIVKQYLQLPHDFQFGHVVAGWADTFLTKTIGETRTETLVVGLFWAVVGMVVYLFLRGLARIAVELDDDLGIRGYVWPKGTDRYGPLRRLAEQFAFRLVAVVALIIVVFEPLAAVLRGPVFVDFLGPNHILQIVVWFVVAVIVWHVAVILLRLMTLRARLFG